MLFRSRTVPRVPTTADGLRIHLSRYGEVPEEWIAWLPDNWCVRDLPLSASGIPDLQVLQRA